MIKLIKKRGMPHVCVIALCCLNIIQVKFLVDDLKVIIIIIIISWEVFEWGLVVHVTFLYIWRLSYFWLRIVNAFVLSNYFFHVFSICVVCLNFTWISFRPDGIYARIKTWSYEHAWYVLYVICVCENGKFTGGEKSFFAVT